MNYVFVSLRKITMVLMTPSTGRREFSHITRTSDTAGAVGSAVASQKVKYRMLSGQHVTPHVYTPQRDGDGNSHTCAHWHSQRQYSHLLSHNRTLVSCEEKL